MQNAMCNTHEAQTFFEIAVYHILCKYFSVDFALDQLAVSAEDGKSLSKLRFSRESKA